MQVPDSGDLYMTDPETSRAHGGRHFCRFPCKTGIAARLAVNDDDARIHPLADIVPNFNFNPQELGTQLPSSFLVPEVRGKPIQDFTDVAAPYVMGSSLQWAQKRDSAFEKSPPDSGHSSTFWSTRRRQWVNACWQGLAFHLCCFWFFV